MRIAPRPKGAGVGRRFFENKEGKEVDATTIKTVVDLRQYAYEQQSSVIAELITGALRFFMEDCKLPNGKRNWKAMKERKRMGLHFRLEEHHELTAEICHALINWMLWHGREIGTSLLDAQLSNAQCVKDPREETFAFLNAIIGRETCSHD
jgi:hypothetical protein